MVLELWRGNPQALVSGQSRRAKGPLTRVMYSSSYSFEHSRFWGRFVARAVDAVVDLLVKLTVAVHKVAIKAATMFAANEGGVTVSALQEPFLYHFRYFVINPWREILVCLWNSWDLNPVLLLRGGILSTSEKNHTKQDAILKKNRSHLPGHSGADRTVQVEECLTLDSLSQKRKGTCPLWRMTRTIPEGMLKNIHIPFTKANARMPF
ncbi:uncharacterized protein LOC125458990 [Stegostoma tigrinum]|uniref:uncharacterized protein LOC125458990 n=1 Tax=Stegostoma tigrinum TaxID=3053191 RepID=UPI00202B9403|nr:uncharacterized protein LOC125458990 [Stegostoma tigrinum]